MGSWQAHLASWVVWWRFKGSLQSVGALRRRIEHDRQTKSARPPAPLETRFIIEERHLGGCVLYDVAPKSEMPNQARILYLHGGCFLFEVDAAHWQMAATLAERLQAVVTLAVFPLAPEHTLLEIFDAVRPVYHDLALPSQDETPFFVVGDSTGGSMGLSLTQEALDAGRPAASRLALMSPCVEFTFLNPEARRVARTDPWLDIPGFEEAVRYLCPDVSPDDPRVSPLYAHVGKLPPTMIFAGATEMLTPDIRKFVAKAAEQGREIEYVEGEGMMHVWPLMHFMPEAEEAVGRLVRWLEYGKGS
ncbi:alpha beta hydrolase fold-3 domain-containing [Trichoderma cornu-damae]|uniref:Alpha beta hydrolase fold-3 domain-containing n=1 Tax=Trichoderma cornu-damae TaxID=654480 RepID=A0A9P8QNL8_9HYPO|nr:alpha beta hydrolase fold-3 domain-containing [Trichoderma cornu-damae]